MKNKRKLTAITAACALTLSLALSGFGGAAYAEGET